MKKNLTNTKIEAFLWLMIVIVWLAALYFYIHFPVRVVSHWNFAGVPNGYSNKLVGAFAIPIVILFVYFLFLVLPSVDPNRKKYSQFAQAYQVLKIAIISVLFVIYLATGLFNLGYQIPINLIVPWVIGILMILIGSLMKKIKSNWFVGIRTPWTMSSPMVWDKTHRLGGKLFMLWGGLILLSPYVPQFWGMVLLLGGAALILVWTTLYSLYLYRKL